MHDIIILASETPWTWALANGLRRRFGDVSVIIEEKEPRTALLSRRIRRLGFVTVMGQVGFGLLARTLRPLFQRHERTILAREDLDTTPVGSIHVGSANDADTIAVLNRLCPKVVVVSQTRILARRVLEGVPAVFINVHTGITPQYRGHHGAYWALVNGDVENCGVTVHVVDAGIDTGPIIAQARIRPSPTDNYFTYHWAQLKAGLPILVQAVEKALAGELATFRPNADSGSPLYYHPTLWGYVWAGLRRGVW